MKDQYARNKVYEEFPWSDKRAFDEIIDLYLESLWIPVDEVPEEFKKGTVLCKGGTYHNTSDWYPSEGYENTSVSEVYYVDHHDYNWVLYEEQDGSVVYCKPTHLAVNPLNNK